MAVIVLKNRRSQKQQHASAIGSDATAGQPLAGEHAAAEELPSEQTLPEPNLSKPSRNKMTKRAMLAEEGLDEPFLTIKQTAEKLRLSLKYVYRAIESGELPCHRFGRVIRISRSDLARFVKRRRH